MSALSFCSSNVWQNMYRKNVASVRHVSIIGPGTGEEHYKIFFFLPTYLSFFFIFRCGTTSWIVRYCLTDFMEQETRCVPIAVCLILLLLSVLPSCSVDFFFSFCFVLVFSKLFVSLSWWLFCCLFHVHLILLFYWITNLAAYNGWSLWQENIGICIFRLFFSSTAWPP